MFPSKGSSPICVSMPNRTKAVVSFEAHPQSAKALRPWIQRLLQDTKEVRSEYVVGLGSATYGSLVRRLLGGELAGGVSPSPVDVGRDSP